MISKDQLIQQIQHLNLSDHQDYIIKHSKPSIHIKRSYVADESTMPIGSSKMGGNPDLPDGFRWQAYKGLPLTFLFQIKLSDVTPYDIEKVLPETGWLVFFYEMSSLPYGDIDQVGGWHIEYIAHQRTLLKRIPHPTAQGEWMPIQSLPAFSLTFSTAWIPSGSDAVYQYFNSINQGEAYSQLLDWVEQTLYPIHLLLGNVMQIQGDPEVEAQVGFNGHRFGGENYAEIYQKVKDGVADWRLLLQVDSDYVEEANMDLMFGDAGRLYYLIRQQDLHARQFDKSWQIMQCS